MALDYEERQELKRRVSEASKERAEIYRRVDTEIEKEWRVPITERFPGLLDRNRIPDKLIEICSPKLREPVERARRVTYVPVYGEFPCDEKDCNFVGKTEPGLSVHKKKKHGISVSRPVLKTKAEEPKLQEPKPQDPKPEGQPPAKLDSISFRYERAMFEENPAQGISALAGMITSSETVRQETLQRITQLQEHVAHENSLLEKIQGNIAEMKKGLADLLELL